MSRVRGRWLAVGVAGLLALTSYLVVSLTSRFEHGDAWDVGEGAVFENGDPDVAYHELRPSGSVQIAITVRNPGRVPMVLDEVRLDSDDVAVIEATMIDRAGQHPQECCRPQDAKPFRRLTVRSGDQVMVWLALRIIGANPYPPCSGFDLTNAAVRYHILKVPRTQALPLQTTIKFRTSCS